MGTRTDRAPTSSDVHWPAGHGPEGASIHVANETLSSAPPEAVWGWLVRPERWRDYYDNARRVRSRSGAWPQVELGSVFSWVTGGVPVTTTITELEPFRRLAWTGQGLGAVGHHAWLLTETPHGGTRILTEETQRGAVLRLLRPVLQRSMGAAHQRWVEGLARAAETGP